jgi:hypothetical protein
MIKNANLFFTISEILLLGILSLCGTLALVNSNAYPLLQKLVSGQAPEILTYLPWMSWGLLFIFGFEAVILRKTGGGSFVWLVVAFSLPALLSFNGLDFPKMLGLNLAIKSQLSFYETLGLAALIMTGYILLGQMSVLKQARLNLIRRSAEMRDIGDVNLKGHLLLLMATCAALTMVIAVALLAHLIETFTVDYLSGIPWRVVSVGLGCILILAVYLYWLGSQRRSV